MSDIRNNPYLAHMRDGDAASTDGRKEGTSASFNALVPLQTTAAQQEAVENDECSGLTGRPYTQKYQNILAKRRDLPVNKQRQKFLDLIHNNQFVVLVGETGSGKTTQIPQYMVYDMLPQVEGKMIACTQPRRLYIV
ncbi:DEAH-box ATP-dependent RNA helicase prp43 [Coemansia sp. S85]|nr:DEAH-box ATP-dependent RNA helicase prp43 [Coemansia sp. S85]